MNRTFIFFIAVMMLATASSAQSKDEKEVAAAVEFLRKALIDGTEKPLSEIAAEELSYGHSNGDIEDKAAFIKRLVTADSDFKTIDLSEQTIRIVGNTAIVRHRLKATTADKGVPGAPNLSVLLIFQKQNGKWKLLARQATKMV
jgi:hypothetical protein